MSVIIDYWNDLRSNVNTRDPIFRWSVFTDKETIGRYINEISDVLSRYEFNNYSPRFWSARHRETDPLRIAFSCLFLVRCALISRLYYRDWDLEIADVFLEGIGQHNFDRGNDWRACITNAERELKRSSLMPFEFEGKVRRFCARVLVEGGIPFSSLAEESKVLYGLKNIWSLRKNTKNEGAYERSVREFLDGGALESPDGRSFWLPGGAAGCRKFFGMGLELLEDVVDESQRSRRTYAQVLRDDCGFVSPEIAASEIFGTSQAEKQSRAVSAINIKRILHWEGDDDDLETQIWIRYEPKSVADCSKITLRNRREEIGSWTYDSGNHTINGVAQEDFHYDDVESEVLLDVTTSYQTKTIEMLQEMDFSAPIFFKHLEDDNYEEITSINDRSFPLCAIIADEFVQDQNLDLRAVDTRKITFGDGSAAYTVYKFPNSASLIKAGLTLTRVELVLVRPNQMLSAVVKKNGHSYRNVLVSTEVPQAPLRCWNSEVIFRENKDDDWNGIDDLEESNWFYGFFKLDTSDPNYVGKRIVVLPSHFRYTFKVQNGVITGVSFGSSQGTCMQPTRIYVDGELADSPDSWSQMTCDSLIQCEFEKNDGSKLVITIPSPVPGLSWFYLNEKTPVSAFNYKSIVKLHCVQNVYRNTSFFYRIRLIDGKTELLNFKHRAIESYGFNNSEMRLDLPGYLSRLFSATNSLNAKIEVVAVASFDGQKISTEPLIITRFDESAYKGDYFCFGLMSLNVLAANVDPTEKEKRFDKWIKVPAKQSINGDWVWNGVNRIVPLGNDIEDTSALSYFQLMLVGNDYEQVKRQLHNYFVGCNYKIDNENLQLISNYFAFCKQYNVPICNLWLLQMVLQDDRIIVQIPNIYEYRNLLDDKTFLCSFDWMLIRPDAIDHVSDEHVRHLLKMHISSTFDERDDVPDFRSTNLDDLDLPALVSTDDDISSYDDEIIAKELRTEMHEFQVNKWACALYFIVTRVVYGSDENYQKWHSWALRTLKLMKCVDGNTVRYCLRRYRSTQREIYNKNRFHDGFNDIVWNEWRMGEVNADLDKVSGIKDYFQYGREQACSRFYFRYGLEAVKKIFGNNFYVKHYGIPWNVIQDTYDFDSLQRIDSRISELDKLYQVYKENYERGWKSVSQDSLPNVICVDPKVFALGRFTKNQIPTLAQNVGKNVVMWQKAWLPLVDTMALPMDCEKLAIHLRKMVPTEIFKGSLFTENEIADLGNRIARKLSVILSDSKEYCVNRSSLRHLGSALYKEAKFGIAREVFEFSYEIFGDYMCAYDLYVVISRIDGRDESLNQLLGQSRKYLDSRYFNKKGLDAFDSLNRKVQMYDSFQSSDVKIIEDQYELSASLGQKSAYANLAKLAYFLFDHWFKTFKDEYTVKSRQCEFHGSSVWFYGMIKKSVEKCLKYIKTMTHHYRCAARLNCKTVFAEYYLWLENGVRNFDDLCAMFNACDKSYDIDAAVSSERSISLIKNKIRLENGWVYLHKAVKNGATLEIRAKWDCVKDFYYAKILDSRDGQVYEIVNIDSKWWLAENLKYKTEGALCTDNGCLYTFDLLPDAMIKGWRCPTKSDYESLDAYCALRSVVHNPAGVSLKSESWKDNCGIRDVLAGTDDFGFNAKPSGMFNNENKSIVRVNEAFFWTSSDVDDRSAYGVNLSSADNALDISLYGKKEAFALRLVCEQPDFYEPLDD